MKLTRQSRWVRAGWSALTLLVVAGIVVGFAIIARAGTDAPEPTEDERSIRVLVDSVVWSDRYQADRAFVGLVEARRSSEIGFEVGGSIVEVLVEEGQLIDQGALIARLDTARLDASLKEAVSAKNEARAQFELAELTRERVRGTSDRGAATTQEIDNAEKNYEATRAALSRADAAAASIQVEIDKAKIYSPYDAVVARRLVDEGRVFPAGEPVVLLLERTGPEVRVGVSSTYANELSPGHSLTVEIDRREYDGIVSAVLPTRDRRARDIDVVVRLDAELNGLRAGDLARVLVPRVIESGGFWLPRRALTEGVRGLWAVYVVESGASGGPTVKRVDVELVHQDGDRVYVRGPVDAGTRYIADGLHRIAPGMRVTPVNEGGDVAAGGGAS
ncbi:MAG: efflux RND transporter periplasmic adaptor subunit [Planctomycetota bacterium]